MSGFFALVFATLIALFGGWIGIVFSAFAEKKTDVLVHLAVGVLLGITAFDILPEAKAHLGWGWFLTAAFGGYLLLWLVGRFVYAVCPSCTIASGHEVDLAAKRGSLILLASALGVHCLLDGAGITAAGAIAGKAGMGVLLGVAVHKLPEGLALALLLRASGQSSWRTTLIVAGIEALTIVGGLTANWFLRTGGSAVVGAMLAVVGGGFVYLVANAFGGALNHRSNRSFRTNLATEFASFAATAALIIILGAS